MDLHDLTSQLNVKNGTKIRFYAAGNYSLKVSTRDNTHHFQYQTFAFRIK